MALVEIVGLRKDFGGLVAVDNLDMSVEQGEMHGLIGPNGSGKTTTLNMISGFLKPTKGKIMWKGRDIAGRPPHAVVKRRIVRTFQLTELLKDMTALQNVVTGLYLHNKWNPLGELFNTRDASKRVKALEEKATGLLEMMGISHVKDELAGELPHGYQRALGIAIALAAGPELLLLDEPITGMNPAETKEMMQRIQNIRETGITMILVEHNMREVMTNCDQITAINFGKKIAEGTPQEVSRNRAVIEAYLGEETYA